MEDKNNGLETRIFPTWCPGCGDFGIWAALKAAIAASGLPRERFVVVYGIGCSGNMASFVKLYGVHGLHGRGIPLAEGIKMANHKLKVIVVGGDGDLLGEGMAHFIAGARMNADISVILHNNQIYGLTTGQSSPTSLKGSKGKATPDGVIDEPVNPVQLALIAGAGHVNRGFAGDIAHLTELIKGAIVYEGFSLVDVLQPCVTFNKLNTYEWFRQRIAKLDRPYERKYEAVIESKWDDERILLGEFYKDENKQAWHRAILQLKEMTLIQKMHQKVDLQEIIDKMR